MFAITMSTYDLRRRRSDRGLAPGLQHPPATQRDSAARQIPARSVRPLARQVNPATGDGRHRV
jgi:hypothetical protein